MSPGYYLISCLILLDLGQTTKYSWYFCINTTGKFFNSIRTISSTKGEVLNNYCWSIAGRSIFALEIFAKKQFNFFYIPVKLFSVNYNFRLWIFLFIWRITFIMYNYKLICTLIFCAWMRSSNAATKRQATFGSSAIPAGNPNLPSFTLTSAEQANLPPIPPDVYQDSLLPTVITTLLQHTQFAINFLLSFLLIEGNYFSDFYWNMKFNSQKSPLVFSAFQ